MTSTPDDCYACEREEMKEIGLKEAELMCEKNTTNEMIKVEPLMELVV